MAFFPVITASRNLVTRDAIPSIFLLCGQVYYEDVREEKTVCPKWTPLFIVADHARKYLRRVQVNYERVASKEKNDEERNTLLAYWPHIHSFVPTRPYDTWYNSQIITNAYPSTRNVFGARVLLVLSTLSLSHVCHTIWIRG